MIKYFLSYCPNSELYFRVRILASCYTWMLSWPEDVYLDVPIITWGLWLLSDLISCYRRNLCWSTKRGGGEENAEPQSFTLFSPLLLLLLLPILDHLCCPDPDHNLGGWCYRKPDAPGEIVLLHGDSSIFTSSLTGCLKEEREEGGMWGGWGDNGGLRRREGRGQSDFNSSVKRTKKKDPLLTCFKT